MELPSATSMSTSTSTSTNTIRWQDLLAQHLPAPLRDSRVPAEYFVIVPTTLLALVLAYTLTARPASRLEHAHTIASSSSLSAPLSASDAKRSAGKAPTVLLVGLQDSGKTSLFSALVYNTVPPTLPSQVESHGQVELAQASKPTNLTDLPGHPRLRPLLAEHVSHADALVICIDAVMATKAVSSSKPADGDALTDAADLVHSALTSLARNRQRNNAAPPSVLVLFTRSDLSPLLSNADAAKDEKRRAQLLSRCKTALEAELGRRRAGMGLGRRHGRVRIAGVGKVVDGADAAPSSGTGIFGWIRRALGLGASRVGVQAQDEEEEEEEEEEHKLVDYIDWNAAQRLTEGSAAATAFSLEKLDQDVVFGGKVDWALATAGKERGWTDTDAVDGTADLRSWLAELQQP